MKGRGARSSKQEMMFNHSLTKTGRGSPTATAHVQTDKSWCVYAHTHTHMLVCWRVFDTKPTKYRRRLESN